MSSHSASVFVSPAPKDEFPPQFSQAEAADIAARRALVSQDAPDVVFPDGAVGLALSGGGIRSATFNLGVIQGLAKARLLRVADYLSTVSGGGYIGGFLGRFYTRFLNRPRGAADLVERRLSDPTSPEVRWLRQNGNYLAPSGLGDGTLNAAIFLRNFVTLHTVIGIFLFGLFCLANLFRFEIFPWLGARFEAAAQMVVSGVLPEGLAATVVGWVRFPTPADFPLNHLLQQGWGFFWSPWMLAVEIILLLGLVPLALGYWVVSPDKPRGYQPAALKATFILAAALFAAGLIAFDSPRLAPVLIATSILGSFAWVEIAWNYVRTNYPGGLQHPNTRRIVRNRLTHLLGTTFLLGGIAAGFALLDTAGFALYGWASQRPDFAAAFGELGTGLAFLYPVLRWINKKLGETLKEGTPGGSKALKSLLMNPYVLPVIVAVPPLLLLSLAAHAIFGNGDHGLLGFLATAVALLISVVLGAKDAITFVNRSSLQSTYAARIARAYLGASNQVRQGSTSSQDVTSVEFDDDIKLADYQPQKAGGPLHLIGICLNETVDYFSQRGFRDRHGEIMAVGPAGLSVGAWWHATWYRPSPHEHRGDVLATDPADVPNPFCGPTPAPVSTETLDLSSWLSISGAAISPGRGQTTALGTSLLFGLGNLRTGYWWDSGLYESDRPGLKSVTVLSALLGLPARIFNTQSTLLAEFTARFSGPWRRLWFLSDGGFFENLATYELIRRRVPYIVTSDAGYDPLGQLSDLGNLLQLVRIDFDADVRFLKRAEIDALDLPAGIKEALGELDDVRIDPATGRVRKHAALARIYYRGSAESGGVLLYLKSGLTGDESADVLSYQAQHPKFPNDPTSDQFFDQAQWESYRKLGEHTIQHLLADPAVGFWLPRVR